MGVEMGIHARVGLVAGTIGFALLYVAQPFAGAAAVTLAVVVGLLAGLGTAKWLPRDWYGRQLEAGARAGVLACAVALAGFLVSLVVAGAHTTEQLAARSHLVGIDLGAVVRALGVVGWLGAGVALALGGLAVGTGVAALASQVGAWDKNRHAIEVVKLARDAAQRSGRVAEAASRTKPSLPSLPSWPPLPNTPPPDRDLAGDDLAGLNESWHSLRSPLNVVPAPDVSEKPWTRYDDRLPPGALLPDELALDSADEHDTAPARSMNGANGLEAVSGANGVEVDAGAAAWSDGAWRADAGWMDYEDGGGAPTAPAEPAPAATTLPESSEDGAWDDSDEPGGADGAEQADGGEPGDGEESDSWLN